MNVLTVAPTYKSSELSFKITNWLCGLRILSVLPVVHR
jgi:hypothetical protein